MKVSITKAAKLAGVSRTTLYNDMNSGKLTYIASGKNKKVIDVAELERVYGSLTVQDNDQPSTTVKTEQKPTTSKAESDTALIELAVLRERLETLETERKREREQFEERIEQLQETLNKTQDNQTKTTLLLEHYTKEGRGGEWEKAIKTLEDRIGNQEKIARRQRAALEKELEEERSKGFFERLFG